ncbi:Ras domain containing protein [Aphelenchoides besseyi]|nr:Ras domain containing protein [Aphelenchoides besseyi]
MNGCSRPSVCRRELQPGMYARQSNAVGRCRSQMPTRKQQAARFSYDMTSSRPTPCNNPMQLTVVLMGPPRVSFGRKVHVDRPVSMGEGEFMRCGLKYSKFQYIREYRPTVEEFHFIEYETEQNESLTIQIIDSSGSRDFIAMRELYYKTGDAFIIVYSYNDPMTFGEAIEIMEQIQERNLKDPAILLVANKADVNRLPDANGNSVHDWGPDPQDYALKHRIPVQIISAKNLKEVQKTFWKLMEELRVSYSPTELQLRKRRQSLPSRRTASDLGIDVMALERLAHRYDQSKRRANCIIS